MESLIIGIISSIVGGICVFLFQKLAAQKLESKGAFTGYWESKIFDKTGKVIKQDLFFMKHKGDLIQGDISRFIPENQVHREWKFSGRLCGHNFISVFWPSDKGVLSYGCWYLHQNDDFSFDGFYLRLDEEQANIIETVPLKLNKISDIQRINLLKKQAKYK